MRIDFVDTPEGLGRVGITFAPGRNDRSLRGDVEYRRNLRSDLDALRQAGAKVLVTLVMTYELINYMHIHQRELAREADRAGIEWIWYPIIDGQVPTGGFRKLLDELEIRVNSGLNVVIHCRGGKGRAGTVTACLLGRLWGWDARQAVRHVRQRRDGAIETLTQERFIEATLGGQIDGPRSYTSRPWYLEPRRPPSRS